jgi:hypothetical protein
MRPAEEAQMSYQRALARIHLQGRGGQASQENLDHPALMAELIGWDPWDDPYRAYLQAYAALDVDWIIGIPKPRLGRGAFARATSLALGDGARMTEWGLSGSYWREEYPFHSVEEVLAYDPLVNEPSIPFVTEEAARRWRDSILETQRDVGEAAMISGIHYTTLFQCGIMAFGWPLFLETAAAYPAAFRRVLRGFAEVSRRNLALWAQLTPPLVLIHDDIAMQRGLVFRPAWYREQLYPLYEYILEPLLANRGIRVAFVSDGDYSAALPDLVALGFHGFFINPNMSLADAARAYGRDHFLVGNVDTAVLTFGTPEDVRRAVARVQEEARPCAGHFIKAMGDLPHNIPLANLRAYFEAYRGAHAN